MGTVASQITSLTIVYKTVYSDANQSKHPSSASLAFVWGIHRGPVNSPHKWPVTRKMFSFDDVIMVLGKLRVWYCGKHCICIVVVCVTRGYYPLPLAYQITHRSLILGQHCTWRCPAPNVSRASPDPVRIDQRRPCSLFLFPFLCQVTHGQMTSFKMTKIPRNFVTVPSAPFTDMD